MGWSQQVKWTRERETQSGRTGELGSYWHSVLIVIATYYCIILMCIMLSYIFTCQISPL